jgi:ribonuclease BN (tRNA processing enzyme)
MRLQVLGCSGGIAARHWTTALLLDDDVLIDAGTGVNELSLEAMARLQHVVLTHSHLDHIACLPLLIDSVFDRLAQPLTVHGLPETLRALRQHIFNDVIWPDFSRLPDPARPVLRYAELQPGTPLELGERTLTPIRVNHSVPAVGYRIDGPSGSLVFSGDTTTNDLRKLAHRPKVYLTHPKPGDEDIIFSECRKHLTGYDLHRLCEGDTFHL